MGWGDSVVNNSIFGDYPTNYAEFQPNGELLLFGTARVKVATKIFTQSELQYGISPPSAGNIGNFQTSSYTINDDSLLTAAVLARKDAGEDIEVVVKWICNETYATDSGEVQWQVEWSAIPEDETIALDNPTYSGTIKSGDLTIPEIAKSVKYTAITIPGSNILNIDNLGIEFKRIDIDTGNNPTAEPEVLLIGILDITNKLGEALS